MQPTYNPNGLLVCDEDELLASSGGSKTDARQRRTSLELWGGVECTVNRVGDRYQDQLELNGHALREPDLDLFAGLGIRAIRYPVIWERTMPGEPDAADWSWPDRRLRRLQRLGIRPIVGLIHHGSGPRHTSLVDPDFPEKLAAYAGAVAARYPWLDAYTPVNEPLTTARFSGLYGHWYPHGRDPHTFARTLIHQCRAVALSMRAIRRVNPLAQLVQTDDLGKTFSTPGLAYQAEFENERRWVTWDLLCGKVDSEHPMWNHLLWSSVEQRELEWFLENPCPPDILGLNYYMTSERFLDERYELYPESVRGGNGRHIYADVEAVRVCTEGPSGAEAILEEAWERYHLPIAVTEAHLGCTREEQLRWLLEVWNGARAVQGRGADIRAVTIWSLLGAFDWNSLLTRPDRHYEPGVYDLRGGWPRPTALAGLARELAEGQEPQHPVLSVPGWWRQPSRLVYPCQSRLAVVDADGDKGPEVAACPRSAPVRGLGQETPPRPLVITGATGTLGKAFSRLCDQRGLAHRLLSRHDMDIADAASVAGVLDEVQPWAAVNTAGYVRVDDAEAEPERCYRENTLGPAVLAAACERRGLPLITFSSDLVFDGTRREPYRERDAVNPLNVYGRSKAQAELRVLDLHPGALVIRTSAFFGPWDEYNFVTQALRALAAGEAFAAASDAVISPTYVLDLVQAALDLLIDGVSGVWHLANPGAVTWAELARQAAATVGVDAGRLEEKPVRAFGWAAARPLYSALTSERGVLLPPLADALARYARDCEGCWLPADMRVAA